MKKIFFFILSILLPILMQSQSLKYVNNLINKNSKEQPKFESNDLAYHLNYHENLSYPIQCTSFNRNENLLNDDTLFNKKYSIWKPALEVVGFNALTWAYDRYMLNADYSIISINTWKHNIKTGWEWDKDRFGINFIFHPYSGAMCFNTSRTSGYNYFESVPFAIGGSLMWEYFGENTLPSYNDIINTPVNGALIGEILYRISSNILDDRKRGAERVFREIFAGIIDPVRGINRIIQGKTFRITSKEVYQKEPLSIMLAGGVQKINNGTNFGTGEASGLASLDIVYGDAFEKRNRKPFDYFETKIVLDNGDGATKRILDNFSAYGILFGKNVQSGKMEMLLGGFQNYDYNNNNTFELGNITFSGGILSKLPVGKKSFLYTNLHLGIVPFGGYSTKLGPDTSEFRDYNFGGGMGGKFKSTLDICNLVNVGFSADYYWMRTYSGTPGNNLIGIIKPSILFRVYKNLNLGFEYFLYANDRNPGKHPDFDMKNSEQRIILLYDFKN
ncbi:MAG: DUF3943 domain-containing protein [Bacteroidales bacterium]|jgi:hypothetical protein